MIPAAEPYRVGIGKVLTEIEMERLKQIHRHGFDAAHDDAHHRAEIAVAGVHYAAAAATATYFYAEEYSGETPFSRKDTLAWLNWPWDLKFWKPGTSREMLVKAAALLVAEIERLDRAAASKKGEPK